MKNNLLVKKLICDRLVAAAAQEMAECAKNGLLDDDQLRLLIDLDDKYIASVKEIIL